MTMDPSKLRDRLRVHVRPDAQVVGIEIDPQRVADAQPLAGDGLSFRYGGFEVPLDGVSVIASPPSGSAGDA